MKKSLLVAVSLLLVAVLAIGGSLAYLLSEDDDTNVMVVGNVSIEQLEYERATDADGNYITTGTTDEYGYTPDDLQEYTQDKVIIPAVYDTIEWADDQQSWGEVGAPGSNQLFNDAMKNVQDKFVFVKNTGSVDAIYRTIVAVECPEGFNSDLLHLNITGNALFTWNELGFTNISGVRYFLLEATYNQALVPGEISRPSFLQVFLDKAATNEDVALFDGLLNILVASQGVQADGFASPEAALDEAFYDVTVDQHPWTVVVVDVSNATELADALATAEEGTVINMLAADYGVVTINSEIPEGIVFSGNDGVVAEFVIGADAVLNNVQFTEFNIDNDASTGSYFDGGFINIKAGAEVNGLVVSDSTFTCTGGRASVVTVSEPTTTMTITNCVVESSKYFVYGSAPIAQLDILGCEVNNLASWAILLNGSDSVGAKLTIDNCAFTNCVDGIAKYLGAAQPAGAATVFTNNTLVNCKGHDGSDAKWFQIPGAASTVTVAGNTLDGAAFTPGTANGLGK